MPLSQSGTYKILLVDDEPGDIGLAKLALSESPYDCQLTVASNGKEALAILRRDGPRTFSPDLVLLDINMPLMNGKEVLRAMKSEKSLASIPVVMLTTSEMDRDVAECYELGAAGYVTKPAEMEELQTALQGIQDYWFSRVRIPRRQN